MRITTLQERPGRYLEYGDSEMIRAAGDPEPSWWKLGGEQVFGAHLLSSWSGIMREPPIDWVGKVAVG